MGESKCLKKVPSFLALLRSGEYLRSSCWARNCSVNGMSILPGQYRR